MAWKLILTNHALFLFMLGLLFLISCGFPAVSSHESESRQEWVFTFDGTGSNSDVADGIAVDASGNVYLTGTARMGGATSSFNDYVTLKIGPTGNQVWQASYNGTGGDFDDANAVAVDGSGNVFVTGFCRNGGATATFNDYCTIGYDSAGAQLWATARDGTGANSDVANAIGVDSSGNVYVTGTCRSGATSATQDYCTVKYNGTTGAEVWATVTNGTGGGLDEGLALAVDNTNSRVYVTGRSTGVGSGTDYMTISYNATTGAVVWNSRYNGGGNTTDIARALTFDSSGNVYITGDATGAGTGTDMVTVKYDSTGTQQWASSYNQAGQADDGRGVAVDSSGNVYVTGGSQSGAASSTRDYVTAKYDANGNQLWITLFSGAGNDADRGRAIAVDSAGNVYVAGQSTGNGSGTDLATLKYDANGNQLWLQTYNGGGNSTDDAFVMAIREASPATIYVGGDTTGSASLLDYIAIAYTQPGDCGY